MSHQIVKQPNGKYLIWSTIIDHVVLADATKEQLVDYYIEREKLQILEDINTVTQKLNNNEQPYRQFTKTYDQVLASIERHHGKEELEKFITEVNK